MKASLNASEEEIIMVTITAHPPHITHYQHFQEAELGVAGILDVVPIRTNLRKG
jgi:hypothetical protein